MFFEHLKLCIRFPKQTERSSDPPDVWTGVELHSPVSPDLRSTPLPTPHGPTGPQVQPSPTLGGLYRTRFRDVWSSGHASLATRTCVREHDMSRIIPSSLHFMPGSQVHLRDTLMSEITLLQATLHQLFGAHEPSGERREKLDSAWR